jgi:hypothetical protein
MITEQQDNKENLNNLKKIILEKEEKKGFFSERFSKIELQVKQSLKEQNTDEALKNITL